MNYGKSFVRGLSAAVFCLCPLLAHDSLAAPIKPDTTSSSVFGVDGNFYAELSYTPAVPFIKEFAITEFKVTGGGVNKSPIVKGYSAARESIEIGVPGNFTQSSPKIEFGRSMLGSFSGAVGYAIGGPRVELEVGYRRFNTLVSSDYKNAGAGKYFAIGTGSALAGDNYVVAKLESVSDTTLMLNACYDIIQSSLAITPYICAGVGGSFISLAEDHFVSKPAYKLQAGLSYQITPDITISVGGYYHRVWGSEYSDIPAIHPPAQATGGSKFTATTAIGHAGGHIGVRFAF